MKKTSILFSRAAFFAVLAALMLASCVPQRKMLYLQASSARGDYGYGYGYYSDEGKEKKQSFFKRLLNKI